MAGTAKSGGLRMFKLAEIDEIDETEQVWSGDFKELEDVLQKAGKDDEMVQAELHEKCQQPAGHQHMIQALIFGMICDRLRSKDLLRYLTLIVKDNYQYCIKQLVVLAHDKWPKMNDRNAAAASQQQMQLVWLVKELVAIRVAGIDKVCAALLRQIQGGNVKSATNRWLASFMCALFQEHKTWLKELVPSDTRLIAHVFYTFTRLAADHTDQKYDKMRRQEVLLCCELFQEHFSDCRVIGRDILRILQDVSRLDGFDKLWEALLNQPSRFGGLSDISDLFNVKTHPDFLRSRLTPEMEKQLVFIMQHVKMGHQQRYQRWFMTKWDLSSPESETLIADMLRFVCGAHHPPNSVIRSDVVQRWAVVGWLLKCVKSPVGLANIKLAIFYDWLFFNPKYDSVMNIEPAALLIWKSTPKWIDITVDLTEFLLAIADKWGGDVYRDRCREGIFSAARDCVQKGVIPTWAVISAYQCRCAPGAGGAAGCRCSKLSDALRCRVRAQFYTLCHSDEEKPNPDDVKLYGFIANAPPPQRDLPSPPAFSRESHPREGSVGSSPSGQAAAADSDGESSPVAAGRQGSWQPAGDEAAEGLISSASGSTSPTSGSSSAPSMPGVRPVSPLAKGVSSGGGEERPPEGSDDGNGQGEDDEYGGTDWGGAGGGRAASSARSAAVPVPEALDSVGAVATPLRQLLKSWVGEGAHLPGGDGLRAGLMAVLSGVVDVAGDDAERMSLLLAGVAQAMVSALCASIAAAPAYSMLAAPSAGPASFASAAYLSQRNATAGTGRGIFIFAQLALYIDSRAQAASDSGSTVPKHVFSTMLELLAQHMAAYLDRESEAAVRLTPWLLIALSSSPLCTSSTKEHASSPAASPTVSTPPPHAHADGAEANHREQRRLGLYRLVLEQQLKRSPGAGEEEARSVSTLIQVDVRDLVAAADSKLVADLVPHLLLEFPSVMLDTLNGSDAGGAGVGGAGAAEAYGGGLLAMVCAIQTPASQIDLAALLSMGQVSLVPAGGDVSSAQWVEGLAAIVQASFSWDAVEAQTLWVLLGSELAAKDAADLEKGLAKVVALLDTSMRNQPLGTHWEAVRGCVSTLGYLKATPRLVYVVSQMAQFLSRLPGKPGKVAASVLARWARSDAAGVSSAIEHLLHLRPLGPDENPDVSCVILLLGLWLDVAQSAPPEVVSALVKLMEDDSKPMVALRQELSLCPDWTTQELERLLMHIPKSGLDASPLIRASTSVATSGVGMGGGAGGAPANKRLRADDAPEPAAAGGSAPKRSRRGASS